MLELNGSVDLDMQIYLDYSATTPTRPEAIALHHSFIGVE
jgi:hypothetical protein